MRIPSFECALLAHGSSPVPQMEIGFRHRLISGWIESMLRIVRRKAGWGVRRFAIFFRWFWIGIGHCAQIVEAHGGPICAESRAEGEARFRMRMPASVN